MHNAYNSYNRQLWLDKDYKSYRRERSATAPVRSSKNFETLERS